MVKAVSEMTLAELERAFAAKKHQLEALLAKRERLQRQLAKVDRRIAQLQGHHPGRVIRRPHRRNRNPESLQAVVLAILRNSKKGLTLAELQEKVLRSGYKTKASSFRNVLYQCVYKMYKTSEVAYDDSTGRYVAKA
jgi:septal ring factor EnvC (AmiA/AmiB activator)